MKAQSEKAKSDFRTALYVCQHGKPYYHYYNGSGLARYGYRLGQLAVEHAAVGSGDDDKPWISIVLTKSHAIVWELEHGRAKQGDWILLWQYFKHWHRAPESEDQGLIIEAQYSRRRGDELHATKLLSKAQALCVARNFSVNHWGRVVRVVDNNTGELYGEYQCGMNNLFGEDHYPRPVYITDTSWVLWMRKDEAVVYSKGIPVGCLTNRRPQRLVGRWIWDAKYVSTVTDLADRVDGLWSWARVSLRTTTHAKLTRLVQEIAGGQR